MNVNIFRPRANLLFKCTCANVSKKKKKKLNKTNWYWYQGKCQAHSTYLLDKHYHVMLTTVSTLCP